MDVKSLLARHTALQNRDKIVSLSSIVRTHRKTFSSSCSIPKHSSSIFHNPLNNLTWTLRLYFMPWIKSYTQLRVSDRELLTWCGDVWRRRSSLHHLQHISGEPDSDLKDIARFLEQDLMGLSFSENKWRFLYVKQHLIAHAWFWFPRVKRLQNLSFISEHPLKLDYDRDTHLYTEECMSWWMNC